ncbi:PDZ domain-containing protein [Oceanobacillus picturae]|uniref:PDZ domain-containing protein n=1 Tax=Oceanobacillus picturae TaxID=171693 RepID=UPI000E67BE0D|nr:PDZ domain-containing protein [Oceanobacillus picturae]RIU94516.1 PDZ domain-containing protein [Oceanobacillus picturae]
MVEAWLIELAKGMAKLFINPLLYWSIIVLLFAGYRRIKRERQNFGTKIFDVFSEWKSTWLFSILTGLLVSAVMIGAGFVLSYTSLLLLSVVAILFSLSGRFMFLSPVYTVGISFLLLLFVPTLLGNQQWIREDFFDPINLAAFPVLLGILLIAEGWLIKRTNMRDTYPGLSLSNRGIWVGEHHLKKLAIIPFFLLLPSGLITPFADYWPYVSLGEQTYSLILFPFLLGVDYKVRGRYPKEAADKLAVPIILLGIGATAIAIGGVFFAPLSLAAVIVTIFGKEYINYRHRNSERLRRCYFHPMNNGLKVLGVIPGTPADRLGIEVGENIVKVNGQMVNSIDSFYQSLQASGAYFKLDIEDLNGEIRFVQGALYQGDHHELGILFSDTPYRRKQA